MKTMKMNDDLIVINNFVVIPRSAVAAYYIYISYKDEKKWRVRTVSGDEYGIENGELIEQLEAIVSNG